MLWHVKQLLQLKQKKCKANEHLEGTTFVANTKQVACDNTNINSANGTVSNNQVTITRSNGRWSAPEKCTLNCNTGYEKKTDPATHRESCEKKTGQQSAWTPPRTVLIVYSVLSPTNISFTPRKSPTGVVKNYSLTSNDASHDTYYAIVNEIVRPIDPQVTIGNWFGIKSWITMNLTETGFNLGKTEEKLELTANDSVIIYQCTEN